MTNARMLVSNLIKTDFKPAFLLVMDGVICREDQLISGALELIESFYANGIPFLFLTNNSTPTPEDLVVKMRHLGIDGLAARPAVKPSHCPAAGDGTPPIPRIIANAHHARR